MRSLPTRHAPAVGNGRMTSTAEAHTHHPTATVAGLVQAEVDARQPRRRLLTTWSGPATVLAYTVAHARDGSPQQGLVVLDTDAGRALARVHGPDLLVDAESRELVGETVKVTTDGKRNEAHW
jgi:acetyl-CoA C-acetyltransferase